MTNKNYEIKTHILYLCVFFMRCIIWRKLTVGQLIGPVNQT